ncbi:hypothetical protein CL622_04050 [archaeon]|nr:hypothetical protein [archaeon]|tara:strand:+ start:279 stop:866 length:588 start_codon:yes stop_codon:yes gene_type:complete
MGQKPQKDENTDKKTAVLTVHLHTSHWDFFVPASGQTKKEAFECVRYVLEKATQNHLQIILGEDTNHKPSSHHQLDKSETHPLSYKGIQGFSPYIIKSTGRDLFISPFLQPYIESNNIASLVMIGYNINVCVEETIRGAKKMGLNVLTCPQILFGSSGFRENSSVTKRTLNAYQHDDAITTYPTVEELVEKEFIQ